MSVRSITQKYMEGTITFLYDNTRGLESELNALLQALRSRKIRWTGKLPAVHKKQVSREIVKNPKNQ